MYPFETDPKYQRWRTSILMESSASEQTEPGALPFDQWREEAECVLRYLIRALRRCRKDRKPDQDSQGKVDEEKRWILGNMLIELCGDIEFYMVLCIHPEYGAADCENLIEHELICLDMQKRAYRAAIDCQIEQESAIRQHLGASFSHVAHALKHVEWSDLLELTLEKAVGLGDTGARRTLSFFARRGEVVHRENYPPERLMELLMPCVANQRPGPIVEMALVLATMLGTPEDWVLADQLFGRIPRNLGRPTIALHGKMAEDGELEGYLILLWFRRHGFTVQEDLAGGPEQWEQEVRRRLPYVPDWLFERIK